MELKKHIVLSIEHDMIICSTFNTDVDDVVNIGKLIGAVIE